MGEKLTKAQVKALAWCPADGSRHWNGERYGAPNKAALRSCLRRNWVVRVGHPNMDLYALTNAGRAALTQSGREGRDG